MAVAIPWAAVHGLSQHFQITTQMTTAEADKAALWVREIALAAGESALSTALFRATTMVDIVRTDLTNSLNYASNYLSDDIHVLRSYVVNELTTALDTIVESSGSVTDAVAENIEKAYNAIGDSQKFAGEAIDKSIVATGEYIGETYEVVSGWLHQQFEGAMSALNITIDQITGLSSSYIHEAVKVLIPAEMQALTSTIDDVLTGKGMESLLRLLGKKMGAALGSVFAFDEKDIKEWTFKMVNMIKEQMEVELG